MTFQRYSDRRVLITGAGSGIGQACALRILDEGGHVVAADISDSGLADTVAKAGTNAGRLNTVVIDVGVNRIEDTSNPKGYRLVGDVDFANVRPRARLITPNPGGVGPMTITMLR